MRVLQEQHKIQIFDPVARDTVELTYAAPDYATITKYSTALWDSKEDILMFPEIRINYGYDILKGIPENYFQDENGKFISSNPENENYREDWKDLIKKYASELLAYLAEQVFEAELKVKREKLAAQLAHAGIAVNLGKNTKKKTDSPNS